jgi:hypothetical protein
MLKRLCLILSVFCLFAGTALADLSPNPWLEANDEEDLKEVYAKNRKHNNNNMAGYTSEGETLIDRSHAYVELPQDDEKEDTGFLGKFSDSFKKKEEAPLITRATAKRRAAKAKAVEAQSAGNGSDSSDMMSGFGLDKLKKGIKLPSLNANGLIQKFERASGIDLKSMGKSLKF